LLNKIISTLLIVFFVGFSLAENELERLSIKELVNLIPESSKTKGVFYSKSGVPTSESVNIGLIIPFSKSKLTSLEYIEAADFAAKEINDMGGINGKRLIVISGDSSNIKSSLPIIEKMSNQFNIQAIVGPLSSRHAIDIAEKISIAKNIPMILPASNANEISFIDDNDLIFRLTATNHQIAEKIIESIRQNKFTNIAIFYQNEIFGDELMNEIRQESNLGSYKVAYTKYLNKNVNYETYDLTSDINTMQEQNVEAIFLPVLPEQSFALIKQVVNRWNGDLPVFIFPEYANRTFDIMKLFSKRRGRIYAIIPSSNHNECSYIAGVEKKLFTQFASYTSRFIYDSVYLIAASLVYSELHEKTFSSALRNVTDPEGVFFETKNFHQIKMFSKNGRTLSFKLSNRPSFNQFGDNIKIDLKIINNYELEINKNCE
jgi:ABC-type branched-subunit amino acid transport system substrate-binding protein